jgi:flagellar basal body-associated protein FliL
MFMQLRITTVLSTILCILAGVIVLGTVIAFASKQAEPGADLRKAEKMPTSPGNGISYTSLGQMRVSTLPPDAHSDGELVIVTAWFSYPSGDSAFDEEIFQKLRKIKSVVMDYFPRHTKKELLDMGETAVKKELARNINAELVLGAIENLYFDDYIFF